LRASPEAYSRIFQE